MGTPHRGPENTSWALLLSGIVNAAFLGQAVRTDLLRELEMNSNTLMDVPKQFVHRSAPLLIKSFIEIQAELPLRQLVGIPQPNTRHVNN